MLIMRQGVRSRGLFLASLMIGAVIGAPVAHAQLLYLHSPAEEKASNQVNEGIEAAKKAHLEALDKHKARLEEAVARERQLVAQRELASRDAMVMEIMEHQDKSDDPVAELETEMGSRLDTLVGTNDDGLAFLGKLPRSLRSRAEDLNRARLHYQEALDSRDLAIKAFEAGKGEGKYCKEEGDPVPTFTKEGSAGAAFAAIKAHCENMAAAREEETEALDKLSPAAQAIVGARKPQGVKGELGEAIAESARLAELVTAQDRLTKAAKQQLDKLEKYHRCQVKLAADPATSDEVKESAAKIARFTTWLANLNASNLSAQLPDQPAAEGPKPAVKPSDCESKIEGGTEKAEKPPEVDSTADLAESAQLEPARLKQLLNLAGDFDPARSLAAAVRQGAEEYKAGKLSEIVDAFANPDAEAEDKKAQAAAAILRLIDDFGKLRQARGGTLPDTSAVLVRLAGARMKASSAQLEAQRLRQLSGLAELKVAALRREALDLVDAAQLLKANPAALDRALMKYSDSWGFGRMPSRVVETDVRNAQYVTWAARERVAIEAAYGVLEPAATELQAYGASGIKASDLAGYLRTIGVGAIAIGDNE